jgi:hypothetical protein
MTDTLNQNSTANFAYLLDFVWGESGAHTAYYTSWDSPVVVGSITYGADPQTRLSVDPGKQTGVVKDEPWTLTLPPLAPLTSLVRPYAFAPVTCRIWEVDPTQSSPAPMLMWEGLVSKVINNPGDARGCIRAEISGYRAFLQYPLGLESKTGCINVLGDGRVCLADLGALQQTVAITSIAGKTLLASALTIPGGMPATYWTFGKISYDGLTIGIADGSASPSLKLLLFPPPEWVGVNAVFTPGCDRTYATCGTVWGQTARFMGLGLRSPSYNPIVGIRQ